MDHSSKQTTEGLAVISGVCCAIGATLIILSFASSFNLLAARVDWELREAFAASSMIHHACFRRNILEASSEILVRMPLLPICLALTGAVIHAWMNRESRRVFVQAARFPAPFVFAFRCLRVVARQRSNALLDHPLCYQESCLTELLCVLRIRFGRPSTVQGAGVAVLGSPDQRLSRVSSNSSLSRFG